MKKRLVSLSVVFALLFTGIIGRCAFIAIDSTYSVDDSYNSYTIDIGSLYTNIYDRLGNKLNNNTTTGVAVIFPDEKNLSELEMLFSNEEIIEIKNELASGYPVKKLTNKKANTKHIRLYDRIEENSDDMICKHLINKAYSGLEKYTDREIGSLSVNFSINARGELLTGDSIKEINNNYDSVDGVIVSIDSRIQRIAEDAASTIPKGAVVILDTETSQVLASVSRGDDYINRAISPFAVGSVFKLVVCICAIENNVYPLYSCNGKITVGDTDFHCQKNKAHSLQNMKQALANSCNCYFVNLALELGADKIYKTAASLGFGDNFSLYNKWSILSGSFPSLSTLNSSGQLALIGFGQGLLTDSPLHFASAVCAIANGGIYNKPTLNISEPTGIKVMTDKTAETLRDYMKYVVTDGTGYLADYNSRTAGKTATAQSGMYINGREVLNTWFAGFYPFDNPKYTIVVMQEDGTSGSENCCPVFCTIVEKLDKM